jgi:hypothetical protein
VKLVFPKKKKKKKKIPVFFLMSFFTIGLMFTAILGEGGLLHAYAMQIHKKNAEELSVDQGEENLKLKKMIYYMRKNPQRAKLHLAERGMLAEKDAVIFHFKDFRDVSSEQVIDEIEGITWYQRVVLRFNLLMKS